MEITKRQHIEAQKRHAKLHELLSEKANIQHTSIHYGLGEIWIESDNKEYTLGYFEDYKELKHVQDYMIDLLDIVDDVIESKHDLLHKVHG